MTFSWQRYYDNNLRAISQGLNALTGGDEDEMICGRVGKRAARGGKVAKVLESILNFFSARGIAPAASSRTRAAAPCCGRI